MRALNTIVANGPGRRLPVILKHLLDLNALGEGSDEARRLLETALIHVAAELDDMTILAIAAEMIASPELPPGLKTALEARLQAAMQPGGPAAADKSAVRVAERRATPRTPASEADNPIAMARRASPDDLARIAALPMLPESITNVIVQRGVREPLLKALANPGARFSRSSLTMLAAIAPGDRPICLALAAREDLPFAIQSMIQPLLPAAA